MEKKETKETANGCTIPQNAKNMKRTLLLQKDSVYYYYIILENGIMTQKGEYEWYKYEHNSSALLDDLKKKYGEFDYIYWI